MNHLRNTDNGHSRPKDLLVHDRRELFNRMDWANGGVLTEGIVVNENQSLSHRESWQELGFPQYFP